MKNIALVRKLESKICNCKLNMSTSHMHSPKHSMIYCLQIHWKYIYHSINTVNACTTHINELNRNIYMYYRYYLKAVSRPKVHVIILNTFIIIIIIYIFHIFFITTLCSIRVNYLPYASRCHVSVTVWRRRNMHQDV